MPTVAAVHGAARPPAVRAAPAGLGAARGDVEEVWAVARDPFDAAARHGTKFVHAPSYGVRRVTFQTSVPIRNGPRKARESQNRGVLIGLG